MRSGHAVTRLACILIVSGIAAGPACSGGEDLPDDAQLQVHYPEQAGRVLRVGDGFVATAAGFAAAGEGRPVPVELPRDGAGAVRFHLPGGVIAVREVGLTGEGTVTESAVAYRRAGGTSYWTAVSRGVEEWLHLGAGAVRRGQAVAAWDVEGARVEQEGDAVVLRQGEGQPALAVSAPAAFAAGGRPVGARLEARGSRLEVFVDADGEDVLVDPMWVQTGSLGIGRTRFAASLLQTGSVFVCGGAAVNYGELYTPFLANPVQGSWVQSGNLTYRRQDHTQTTLADGKVLIVGGALGNSAPVQAELYDPTTGMITVTGSMAASRINHTATLLPSGKVLIVGGLPPMTTGSTIATAEVYDPATGQFANTGALALGRGMHTATLVGTKVVVAGGQVISGAALAPTNTVEIYNTATGTWAPGAPMALARQYHTATSLLSGKVLVAGGKEAAPTAAAELYDPGANTWAPAAGALAYARWEHSAVRLGNGKVLITGGAGTTPPLPNNTSELFDPATGTFSFAGSLVTGHILATLTLLSNGTILLAGGQTFISETFNTQSPIGTPCMYAGECTSGFCADGVCCSTACNGGACDACSVAAGAQQDGICFPLSNTPCDDGDACSVGDFCGAGVCLAGTPKQCVALDSCHLPGVCDPLNGMCSSPKKPEGTACDDGDGCTVGDFCTGGVCTSGPPNPCTAPDDCHFTGVCNPGTGLCAFPVKSDGAACNDGDACTQADTCQAGACVGASPVTCAAPNQCQTGNACDHASGTCQATAKPDGTSCDDSDVCTKGEQCAGGFCQPGTPLDCSAPDVCHQDGACSPVSGGCVNPPQPDGHPCPGGACIGGGCVLGADAGPGTGGGGGGTGGGATASSSSSASGGSTGPSGGTGGDGGSGGAAGGCGCEAAGAREPGGLGWAAALLLAAASRRRRARR
jgi:MYXO-CTERM domain-containing protein